MPLRGKIIIDEDFSIDADARTFEYRDGDILKRLSVKNIISCKIYADMSGIKNEDYIETCYGRIPFFENSSELVKRLSSAENVLVIEFENEKGKIKFYRKRYGKEDVLQYELRWLINKLIEETL